jgi:hypothetical protein
MNEMEEEINYLKKHFDMEMALLTDENEILKKELKEKMVRINENILSQ